MENIMIYKTLPRKKDRATRTPLATGGELGCPRRVISSCSTSVTRHVTLVAKTDIGWISWLSSTQCDNTHTIFVISIEHMKANGGNMYYLTLCWWQDYILIFVLSVLVPPHNPPNINIYNSNWNIELFGRCGIFSFPIVSSV